MMLLQNSEQNEIELPLSEVYAYTYIPVQGME